MTSAHVTPIQRDRALDERLRGLRRKRLATPGGFSLVEVTMAIAIVSFCLIAVLGLLPTGLKAVKNSNEQAGAANLIGAIATSLRSASTTDGTNYTTSFGGQTISFKNSGGGVSACTWINTGGFTLEGVTNSTWPRLCAAIVVTAPATAPAPVSAFISVGWPATATWNSGSSNWGNCDGSLTGSIQFVPR